MNKNIEKIANEQYPECKVRGHRVHVTFARTGEHWPKWGRCSIGIAGGFIHFESEDDFNDWRSLQKPVVVEERPVVEDVEVGGRCVPECGPIGFKAA